MSPQHDVIYESGLYAAKGATVGVVTAVVANSLKRGGSSPGVLGRTGWMVPYLAGTAAAWQAGFAMSANVRQKEDYVNAFNGGFASGCVMGLRGRSLASVLGFGVVFGSVMATADYLTTRESANMFKTAQERDSAREALFKSSRMDQRVDLSVFEDPEGVRQRVRDEITARV